MNEILIGIDILLIAAIGYGFYSLRAIKNVITGVRSNLRENIVEAEVIEDWTKKAKEYGPNSNKGKAYRNRLREVGHSYRGD